MKTMPEWLKHKSRTTQILMITAGGAIAAGMTAAAGFVITLVVMTYTAERYLDGTTYPEAFNLLILTILMVLVLSAATFAISAAALAASAVAALARRKGKDRCRPGKTRPRRKR